MKVANLLQKAFEKGENDAILGGILTLVFIGSASRCSAKIYPR